MFVIGVPVLAVSALSLGADTPFPSPRGVAATRRPHKPKIVGANPTAATTPA